MLSLRGTLQGKWRSPLLVALVSACACAGRQYWYRRPDDLAAHKPAP